MKKVSIYDDVLNSIEVFALFKKRLLRVEGTLKMSLALESWLGR